MGTINSLHSAFYSATDNLALCQSQDRSFAFCIRHGTDVRNYTIDSLIIQRMKNMEVSVKS